MADRERAASRPLSLWFVGLILIGILTCLSWFLTAQNHRIASGLLPVVSRAPTAQIRQPPTPHPGELILKDYGSASTSPQSDLTSLAQALGNLTLLIKGADPFRLGANEEFAAALRGKNRTRLRFLPDKHPAINAQGQLVDRWLTPLFFHATSQDRIDIRSAGQDRKMWTEDDIHRRYNGQFLKGADLNPSSLFNEQSFGAHGK